MSDIFWQRHNLLQFVSGALRLYSHKVLAWHEALVYKINTSCHVSLAEHEPIYHTEWKLVLMGSHVQVSSPMGINWLEYKKASVHVVFNSLTRLWYLSVKGKEQKGGESEPKWKSKAQKECSYAQLLLEIKQGLAELKDLNNTYLWGD